MARITGSYPDDLDLLIEGAVEAGVFGGKSDALREFVREYFHDGSEPPSEVETEGLDAYGPRFPLWSNVITTR
jgi:Arc/MetJ-type ribon-helix-helix transcriptional regulator